MVNTDKLRGKIYERGFTVTKVASMIGMSRRTIGDKMSNGRFGTVDVEKIARVLHLSRDEIFEIFFAQLVELKATRKEKEEC